MSAITEVPFSMANVTKDARSNLYGNSTLYERTNFNISSAFSETGFAGLPIGHDPDNRNTGFAFDLSRGGQTAGHQLWFGATRSGKGVSGIIPGLLTTLSSCLVVDPKGQNAWATMPRREALGFRSVLLDPWNEVNERYGAQVGVTVNRTTFNPLSAIDPHSKDFNDDIAAIADALIIVDPHDENSHWTAAAKVLLAGLIAASVELKPGIASMRDVREMIQLDDDELARRILDIKAKLGENSLGVRKLRKFSKLVADARAKGKKAAKDAMVPFGAAPSEEDEDAQIKADVSREIGSIRSTAETQTDMFDSEMLLDAMETDAVPFNMEELATGKVTLYLVLPPDRLKTHSRWLRLIITLALRMVARQRKPPALPVMFFIDEMGTIGSLQMIESSYGLLAGLGVRIAGYLQDLSQLQRDYPHSWSTFISNSSVIGLLQCSDTVTANYFSDYLGTYTVEVFEGYTEKTRPVDIENPNKPPGFMERLSKEFANDPSSMPGSEQGKAWAQARHNAKRVTQWEPDKTFHERRVLLPSEVRDSPPDKVIVIVPGKYNLRLQRFIYYSDPVFSKWARHDPNEPRPVIRESVTVPRQETAKASSNDNLQDQVADLGGKAFNWLKDKAKDKFAGK